MTPTTWHISDQLQSELNWVAAFVVALIVIGIWSIVGSIRDADKVAADDAARRAQVDADRLAAHTFCGDFVPQVCDVAALDAGLPQFGRRVA